MARWDAVWGGEAQKRGDLETFVLLAFHDLVCQLSELTQVSDGFFSCRRRMNAENKQLSFVRHPSCRLRCIETNSVFRRCFHPARVSWLESQSIQVPARFGRVKSVFPDGPQKVLTRQKMTASVASIHDIATRLVVRS